MGGFDQPSPFDVNCPRSAAVDTGSGQQRLTLGTRVWTRTSSTAPWTRDPQSDQPVFDYCELTAYLGMYVDVAPTGTVAVDSAASNKISFTINIPASATLGDVQIGVFTDRTGRLLEVAVPMSGYTFSDYGKRVTVPQP